VDLTRVADVSAALAEVAADGLDIVVHAAGIHRLKALAELTEADWDAVQGVNLKSAFFLARDAIGHMSDSGGAIVLISSCSARLAYAGLTPYVASKAGMEGVVRGLACDGAPAGVRVNGVAPGTTHTPMTRHLWGDPRRDAAHRATIPLNRLAQVADIAHACTFLASDFASYITGAVLPVDGGMTAVQADFIDLPLRSGGES
jgi:NAD(P)-dependent dehydrogenase (short-subunit alcohol dehydrogenase family)